MAKGNWDDALLHWAKTYWHLAWPNSHGLAGPWAARPQAEEIRELPHGGSVAAPPFNPVNQWRGQAGKAALE
jgi:hypothetical protein